MSEENPLQQDAQAPGTTLKATQELLTRAHAELGRVIAGQGEVIGQVLVAVLTQGHALLEGVPGIAKTLIVKSVGRLLGLSFQRVQGTPDLMPADILGTTIFKPGSDAFTFHAGPVFTDRSAARPFSAQDQGALSQRGRRAPDAGAASRHERKPAR